MKNKKLKLNELNFSTVLDENQLCMLAGGNEDFLSASPELSTEPDEVSWGLGSPGGRTRMVRAYAVS